MAKKVAIDIDSERKKREAENAPVAFVSPPAEPQEIPPFRALGYLSGTYYYYSRGEQSVVALTASQHGKLSFYRLAPHDYWIKRYPVSKTDDFDSAKAAGVLMDTCQRGGIFTINRIRGRGVWMDKNGPVIHYGDKVTIEGKDYLPFLTPGKHIYELAEALGFEECSPLTNHDGQKFTDLIKQLRWQTNEQHIWFSGWLVCALIGGALPWRPHIWLTGAAQSGKTTLAGIIKQILQNNCLYIQSVSTEAGIRQTLKADCLAVVMDEAEREDASSHNRIQSILTLARQASSDNDSRIVKGTPSGKALDYQIRSPFCLSSINSSLIQSADKGRFSALELSSNKLAGDVYKAWKENLYKLIGGDFSQKLYNRIFSMIPIIVHNATTLANAIETKTGDRRLGDQYGALLAGYRSLIENKVIMDEDAKWMIDPINFDTEKEMATGTNDQFSLLNKIMQHVMRVPKNQGFEELSVAEMCERVSKHGSNNEECKRSLGNIGIRIIEKDIAIANENDNLAEILKSSRWPHNWQQTLKRLPFAKPTDNSIRFGSGCKSRAILIPVEKVVFDDDSQESDPEESQRLL